MAGTNEKRPWEQIAGKLVQLPAALFKLLADKTGTLLHSAKLAPSAQLISVSPEAIQRIRHDLNSQLKQTPPSIPQTFAHLYEADQQIINQIRQQTLHHNRNNITRTAAYWAIYRSHPELHWALLAHMVSRNGGWNMTDLKGDLLPHLLNASQIEHIFAFLERANSLIFHDAYPQLLLYAESKRAKRSLFHLLPLMQISAFMKPVWKEFWVHKESSLLTTALIINEQNYIEKRIVQDTYYKQTVLSTFTFLMQSLMQLNHVVFPYEEQPSAALRLAGLILENFSDINERIEFGKKLYAILFGLPPVHQGVIHFAEKTPHSGSRSDYWPQLFAPIRKAPPEKIFKERLQGCQLIKGASPLYSAHLKDVWPDRPVGSIEKDDWFTHTKPAQPLRHIQPIQVPFLFDMTAEACLSLNKIEMAVLAGQTFDSLD